MSLFLSSLLHGLMKIKVGDVVVFNKRYRGLFPRRKSPGIVLGIKKRSIHGFGGVEVMWSDYGRKSVSNIAWLEVISENNFC